MSWAGAKGNKQFNLKMTTVWELLYDVINSKFPNFQKNIGIHFNNFHKDAGKDVVKVSKQPVRTNRGMAGSDDNGGDEVCPTLAEQEDADSHGPWGTRQYLLINCTTCATSTRHQLIYLSADTASSWCCSLEQLSVPQLRVQL